jgi:glycosyltransferase involved in cell wall biosynthesis
MTAGIRWLAITPGDGYGNAAEAHISGLRAAGVPVTWTPLGYPSARWGTGFGPIDGAGVRGHLHHDIANLPLDHDTVVVHAAPLWHEELEREAGRRQLVAFTTWETDRLPPEWVEILNRYDRIVVPSRFNEAVFSAAPGLRPPVNLVPHVARRPGAARARPDGRFTFYLIATWTSRKAILDAVSAYLQAFSARDAVRLVIHTTPVDLVARGRSERTGVPPMPPGSETWFTLAQALAGLREAAEIRLSTRALGRPELDALHARGDCFVLLSHAEGWGLPAFEAAAAGNPVIVTGYGGSLDFLPEGYPYLVEYELGPTLAAEPDAWWFPRADEQWANARVDHAARLMRDVYGRRAEARAWGDALAAHVNASFAEPVVTRRLIETLS